MDFEVLIDAINVRNNLFSSQASPSSSSCSPTSSTASSYSIADLLSPSKRHAHQSQDTMRNNTVRKTDVNDANKIRNANIFHRPKLSLDILCLHSIASFVKTALKVWLSWLTTWQLCIGKQRWLRYSICVFSYVSNPTFFGLFGGKSKRIQSIDSSLAIFWTWSLQTKLTIQLEGITLFIITVIINLSWEAQIQKQKLVDFFTWNLQKYFKIQKSFLTHVSGFHFYKSDYYAFLFDHLILLNVHRIMKIHQVSSTMYINLIFMIKYGTQFSVSFAMEIPIYIW